VDNPYTPPASDLDAEIKTTTLASGGQRFMAAFIDGIIMMVLVVPAFYLLGLTGGWRGEGQSYGASLMMAVAGFVVYLLINGYLLAASGQTVGKRLVKIKIVGMDGSQPSLAHIMTRRLLPMQLVSIVPIVGGLLSLVDILFIFRADKRCIHDLIADTQVIHA
jgi:uncharacterized RDD family membrane protein YckC